MSRLLTYKIIPKIGDKFGKWTVIDRCFKAYRYILVPCQCNCKIVKLIRLNVLLSGGSNGCLKCSKGNKIHGLSSHPLYAIHQAMVSRCHLKTNKYYKDYGQRGITVCEEWLNFENFYKWAISNGWSPELELERKDNNKGYCPENCIFTTRLAQCNNRRANKYLEAFGETKTMANWARDSRCVVNYILLFKRMKNGWNVEKAITTQPPGKHNRWLTQSPRKIKIFNEEKSVTEWSKDKRAMVS